MLNRGDHMQKRGVRLKSIAFFLFYFLKAEVSGQVFDTKSRSLKFETKRILQAICGNQCIKLFWFFFSRNWLKYRSIKQGTAFKFNFCKTLCLKRSFWLVFPFWKECTVSMLPCIAAIFSQYTYFMPSPRSPLKMMSLGFGILFIYFYLSI